MALKSNYFNIWPAPAPSGGKKWSKHARRDCGPAVRKFGEDMKDTRVKFKSCYCWCVEITSVIVVFMLDVDGGALRSNALLCLETYLYNAGNIAFMFVFTGLVYI